MLSGSRRGGELARTHLGSAFLALLMVAVVGLGADRADATQGEMPAAAVVQSEVVYSDLADAGVHRDAVEALAADGVLDGTECAPGWFCPDAPLTRRTMAVWLVRMLDGDDPDTGGTTRFADVAEDDRWAAHIERLAELRVTRGCLIGPARFCPERAVTRGQMAAFLVRGFQLPPGPDTGFEDVAPGNVFRADIDALAAAGITRGCAVAPARYCPDRAVTRAEMASFLHRARSRVQAPTVHISWIDRVWGPATGCPLVTNVVCRGLLVELDGHWEPVPHWLVCVIDEEPVSAEIFQRGQAPAPGTWPPPHPRGHVTTCGDRLIWGGLSGRTPLFSAVHVIVGEVKSNTLRAERLWATARAVGPAMPT